MKLTVEDMKVVVEFDLLGVLVGLVVMVETRSYKVEVL